MKFYVFPFNTNNATKVLFTAELLQIDYELEVIYPAKGEHKKPEFTRINPMGRIPVMQDNEFFLTEGDAITRYLCQSHNDQLYADNLKDKAIVDQWFDRISLDIGPALAVYTYQELIMGKLYNQTINQEKIDEAEKKLSRFLPILEQQLSEQSWIAGEQITMADTTAMGFFAATDGSSVNLKPYPNILNWKAKLSAMPEWQKVMSQFSILV